MSHDKDTGLYRKYFITRTDGSSEPGGKHADCDYFVLDLNHDMYSKPALAAYADACSNEFPLLAHDLRNKVSQPDDDADTVPHGVGDSGKEPVPVDATVKRIALPTRLEVVAYKSPDGTGWEMEIHGYVVDVTAGRPTRVRSRCRYEDASAARMHDLLMTFFDHELREQLDMNPHASPGEMDDG